MHDIYIEGPAGALLADVKATDLDLDLELAEIQCERDLEAAPGPDMRVTSAAIVRWAANG